MVRALRLLRIPGSILVNSAVRRCRGVPGIANAAYLGGFLCSALLRVAPYCVPGGIRVVSKFALIAGEASGRAPLRVSPWEVRGKRTCCGQLRVRRLL